MMWFKFMYSIARSWSLGRMVSTFCRVREFHNKAHWHLGFHRPFCKLCGTKLLPYEVMVQCKFCRVGLHYECWYTTHAFCSGYLLSEGLRNEDCPYEVESCLTTPRPHSNEPSESDDSDESESHRAMRITNLLETVHTNGLVHLEC